MANIESSMPTPTEVPRHRSKWWLWVIGAIVLVIAMFVWLFASGRIGPKVYAQAAGHKIYKKDLKPMQYVGGQRTSVSDRQAATVLANKYLYEAMARQQGVTVTQADINAAYGSNFNDQKKINPYGYQNLLNQLYLQKLNANNQGTYTGKMLVSNFSRYVPYQSGLLAQQEAANPNMGNPAAIAKDKQYAQSFITNLYNQVKAKQITFDQAIQMEHNDPIVGVKAYPSQRHSGAFSGPLSQIGPLAAASIRSNITSMKPGQLSAPFVVRSSSSATDPKSTAETYFLVVQMDKNSGGNGSMTFQQELAQAKKQFRYKVNV